MLYFLPLFIILRIVAVRILKRNKRRTTFRHEAGAIIFFIYLFMVLHVTINYIRLFHFNFAVSNEFNLIPFRGIRQILGSRESIYAGYNILGNIAMFLPLGVLLPLLWNKWTLLKVSLAGAAFSFFIEFVQLFTGRGTDIDDLLLNTLGALAGYGIYLILRAFFSNHLGKFRITNII